MGCGSSKEQRQNKTEADRYQRKKKNGFKDSGLERHRQDCVDQKKKLRHVEDPAARPVAKKKKKIETNQKKMAEGPTGMTENDIRAVRGNLKHR